VTAVRSSIRCALQRYASVLFWLPLLVLAPSLNLHGGPVQVIFQLVLIATMVVACVAAVLTTDPVRQVRRAPYVALTTLAVAVVLGTTQGQGWLSPWVLLVITVPTVLRGVVGWVAVPVVTAALMVASWLDGDRGLTYWTTVGGALLAGVATTSFLRLVEAVEELRRTRTELARVAVVEERERFSRDLHDLLGHTLSVMVVKAQAVRRLVDQDPVAAAEHAADIERVGRTALVEVREAVDAMRALTLTEELDGARRALDAAGIRAEVLGYDGTVPPSADATLAWVVREGVTNVLRHSGAGTCRFELVPGRDHLSLSVYDDGVGGPVSATDRRGGLDGLRRRVAAAGGSLEVEPGAHGFRLTANVPVRTAAPA
jgi:two-component system sensor histidine kinase DesK